MKENFDNLHKFLNDEKTVNFYNICGMNTIIVNADKKFLSAFGRWNEQNGIVFNIVILTDSRYIVYL